MYNLKRDRNAITWLPVVYNGVCGVELTNQNPGVSPPIKIEHFLYTPSPQTRNINIPQGLYKQVQSVLDFITGSERVS